MDGLTRSMEMASGGASREVPSVAVLILHNCALFSRSNWESLRAKGGCFYTLQSAKIESPSGLLMDCVVSRVFVLYQDNYGCAIRIAQVMYLDL